MSERKLSRRNFLKFVATEAAGAVLASCAPEKSREIGIPLETPFQDIINRNNGNKLDALAECVNSDFGMISSIAPDLMPDYQARVIFDTGMIAFSDLDSVADKTWTIDAGENNPDKKGNVIIYKDAWENATVRDAISWFYSAYTSFGESAASKSYLYPDGQTVPFGFAIVTENSEGNLKIYRVHDILHQAFSKAFVNWAESGYSTQIPDAENGTGSANFVSRIADGKRLPAYVAFWTFQSSNLDLFLQYMTGQPMSDPPNKEEIQSLQNIFEILESFVITVDAGGDPKSAADDFFRLYPKNYPKDIKIS